MGTGIEHNKFTFEMVGGSEPRTIIGRGEHVRISPVGNEFNMSCPAFAYMADKTRRIDDHPIRMSVKETLQPE